MNSDPRRDAVTRYVHAINNKNRLWEQHIRTGRESDRLAAVASDKAVDAALQGMEALTGRNWVTIAQDLGGLTDADKILNYLETVSPRGSR